MEFKDLRVSLFNEYLFTVFDNNTLVVLVDSLTGKVVDGSIGVN